MADRICIGKFQSIKKLLQISINEPVGLLWIWKSVLTCNLHVTCLQLSCLQLSKNTTYIIIILTIVHSDIEVSSIHETYLSTFVRKEKKVAAGNMIMKIMMINQTSNTRWVGDIGPMSRLMLTFVSYKTAAAEAATACGSTRKDSQLLSRILNLTTVLVKFLSMSM